MTKFHKAAHDYLALRRGLGFKLKEHEPRLLHFVSFLARKRAKTITTALTLEWATQPQQCHPSLWAARLRVVRGFAQYWRAMDPMTEIPPADLLPFHRAPVPDPISTLQRKSAVYLMLRERQCGPSPASRRLHITAFSDYCQ